jgi:hypothetical protein
MSVNKSQMSRDGVERFRSTKPMKGSTTFPDIAYPESQEKNYTSGSKRQQYKSSNPNNAGLGENSVITQDMGQSSTLIE